MFLGNDDPADLATLSKAGGIKLLGRDAEIGWSGGFENLIRMLSVHRHGYILENHQECEQILEQLTHNDHFFDTKVDEKKALLKQLLHLKNYEGDENGEDGDLDFAALFGAVETETESYAEYADRSIKLGKDLLNLYAKHKEGYTEELVQLEERAQFTLNVVQKLKNVVLTIIKPCSDVVDELKTNINGHDE